MNRKTQENLKLSYNYGQNNRIFPVHYFHNEQARFASLSIIKIMNRENPVVLAIIVGKFEVFLRFPVHYKNNEQDYFIMIMQQERRKIFVPL